jgi:N-acetylmuramoyl-L-alanine amidase
MAEWIEKFLTVNKYSRPGVKNSGVKGIVMHWTATPGASDDNEVKFFDGADGGGSRYASAHLFVDRDSASLDIPLNEVAYHANDHACRVPSLMPNANFTAIGIEMCVEKDGTIHPETVARAAKVAAALCKQFNLNPASNIFRHFDVTGKNCPAPWVTNVELFNQFKKDVAAVLNPSVAPVQSAPVQNTAGKYTVQNGDTLYGIATKNHLTVAQLKSLNSLTSDTIQPGQVLNVAKVATAAPTVAPKVVASTPTLKVTYTRVLKQGVTGEDVKQLQNALNSIYYKCGIATGVYGPTTTDAVKRFQSVYLPQEVDGIAGKNTIAKLNSLVK